MRIERTDKTMARERTCVITIWVILQATGREVTDVLHHPGPFLDMLRRKASLSCHRRCPNPATHLHGILTLYTLRLRQAHHHSRMVIQSPCCVSGTSLSFYVLHMASCRLV